jgi:hypothetical protein
MKKPWGKQSADLPRRRMRDATQGGERKPQPQNNNSVFRRNRTLVGSLSARVSSVNELGGDLISPRAHAHHLSAHRRRLGTTLVIVLLAVAGLIWLLYEFTAGIQVSPTDNGLVIQQSRYQHAIDDYFAGHPLERIRSLLNEQQLNMYITQVTPEVSILRSNGAAGVATSQFDITFRRPVASWLINSQQYYVDKDGVSFQVNYFDRPTVKIIDQSGVPQTTGTTVASSRFLHFVGRVVDMAKTYGLTVEQAIIPANTTRQIEIKVAQHNYPIKLSLDRPVGEQAEDMSRAIAYLDAHSMKPQYVDVRVSGKAYYK